MKSIVKLIIPDKIEMIFYPVVAFAVLVVNNYKNFIEYIKNEVGVVSVENTNSLLKPAVDAIDSWQQSINPRYFDILAWLIIGLFLITIVMVIDFIVGNISDERSLLGQINNTSNRHNEIKYYLTRVALSLSAGVGLLIFLTVFLSKILPATSYLFYANLAVFDLFSSLVILTGCVLVLAVSLYVFAVLIRLILLRPRVFK